METATTILELRAKVSQARLAGKTIGLVPTMGALHAGHQSLIHRAVEKSGLVVVSVFVNPAQFGPNEDFHRYPRPLDQDLELCRKSGAHLVFHPSVEEMYPSGFQTTVAVAGLTEGLCGASRPGHYRGVTTVVLKLFNQALPDISFFGQKDAQQALVIRKMVKDLDVPIEVEICPTVREADGLAMSSRNRYLSKEERQAAAGIYQALLHLQKAVKEGCKKGDQLLETLRGELKGLAGSTVEYAELVDADSLAPACKVHGDLLVAVAVRFGTTRLIDNLLLHVRD